VAVVAESSVEHPVVRRHEPVGNRELRTVILGRDIICGRRSILAVEDL
jgi:hypothetical protein